MKGNSSRVISPLSSVFFLGIDALLGWGVRTLFRDVRSELDGWLKGALTPLSMQLQEHQRLLEHRVESLRKIASDVNSLQERVRYLEKQQAQMAKQIEDLTRIRDTLSSGTPAVEVPSAVAACN